MAMSGLLVSSICLVLVQAILTGLQGNRVERSKEIEGSYYLSYKADVAYHEEEAKKLLNFLIDEKVSHIPEHKIEGLLKNGNYISPVILHGIDPTHHQLEFLEKRSLAGNLFFSIYIAQKSKALSGDEVQFLSPSHTDSFFGDLPRYKTLTVSKIVDTKDPEIDEFHAWTDLRSVQSLIREKRINGVAIYSQLTQSQLDEIKDKFSNIVELSSWEERHKNLVYALSLENNIILFLFSATVVLVGLCIVSGLSIFFNRLKKDFVSFWILGMSIDKIRRIGIWNVTLITVVTLIIGNVFGVLLCIFLKDFSPTVMPEMFVERSLPIKLSFSSFYYSLLLPLFLAVSFTYFSGMKFINSKADFLNSLRSVGK